MKSLMRGFLAGFGFALGASVAGTLIGYTIGRLGEASVKRFFSPEPTPSPQPSSSPTSSEPSAEPECAGPTECGEPQPDRPGHGRLKVRMPDGTHGCRPDCLCPGEHPHPEMGPQPGAAAAHHKSNYGACPKCGSEIWHFREGDVCSNKECDYSVDPPGETEEKRRRACSENRGHFAGDHAEDCPEHHSDDYGAPGTLCSRHARGNGANGDPAGCLMCLAEEDESHSDAKKCAFCGIVFATLIEARDHETLVHGLSHPSEYADYSGGEDEDDGGNFFRELDKHDVAEKSDG